MSIHGYPWTGQYRPVYDRGMARDDGHARIIDAHFREMTRRLRSDTDWLDAISEPDSMPALEPGRSRLMIRVQVYSQDGECRFTTGDMPVSD